jgi:hypothetical protein
MEEVKSKIYLEDVVRAEWGAPNAKIGIAMKSSDEKALIRRIDQR